MKALNYKNGMLTKLTASVVAANPGELCYKEHVKLLMKYGDEALSVVEPFLKKVTKLHDDVAKLYDIRDWGRTLYLAPIVRALGQSPATKRGTLDFNQVDTIMKKMIEAGNVSGSARTYFAAHSKNIKNVDDL